MRFFILFNLLIIAGNIFSQDCEKVASKIFSEMLNDYKKAFSTLFQNYDICKNNCKYNLQYIKFLSLSNEEIFNKINESDVKIAEECAKGKGSNSLLYYYYRAGRNEEIENYSSEDISYIYYLAKKKDFCEIYKKNPDLGFGKPDAAYLLFKCGMIEDAKKIAEVPYKHRKMGYGKFFDFKWPEAIIHDLIIYKIYGIELNSNERKNVEEAKKHFPFLFEIYGFN